MKKFVTIFLTSCVFSIPLLATAAKPHQSFFPNATPKDKNAKGPSAFFEETDEDEYEASYHASVSRWKIYKGDFGVEKIFLRFPKRPTISQGETTLVAYANDHNVTYSFSGYYPPIGSINAQIWFDEALDFANRDPFQLISYSIYYLDRYDFWVLDYVAHDVYNNIIVRSRSIVTAFNAYTLQATFPNGCYEQFDYFLNAFRVRCDCGY